MKITHLTYTERAPYCLSPLGQNLLRLMDSKQTNLALSADVTSAEELLTLADTLGPEICILKTHADILTDFTPAFTKSLQKLSHQHRFLIFEDRKFADIGNTVKHQYEGGIHQISHWADIISTHSIFGPGQLKGLAEIGRKKNRGAVLLAELSSAGHLIDETYTEQTIAIAEQFADFVIGFVTQHALSADPHWIYFTPGIKLEVGNDSLGQQYETPESAILKRGTDVIIVGRGIIKAKDPLAEAQLYRKRGWDAYQQRC